jgi:hypothetical protein
VDLALQLLSLWFLQAAAGEYAGAAACAGCHPAEFKAQSGTAHARALAPSKPPQPGDWAFGAGVQAITFVKRLDEKYYREEPLTWYRSADGYARTPGHTTPNGVKDRIFDPSAAILRCFACHSTGPLHVSAEQGIIPRELGVRCEACHGPSAVHAREPGLIKPRNPARLSAQEINVSCGACHRMPSAEHDETSLRNPWNVRHQPFMLAASKCFLESKGRLSCFTCHRPHEALETRLAAYDAVCKSCHTALSHTKPTAGRPCAECHMPIVRPQPHLAFANHRIGIYSAANPLIPINAPPR